MHELFLPLSIEIHTEATMGSGLMRKGRSMDRACRV